MILIQLGFRKLQNRQTLPWQVKKNHIAYILIQIGLVTTMSLQMLLVKFLWSIYLYVQILLLVYKIDNDPIAWNVFLLTQNTAKIDQLELWYDRDSFKIVLYILMSVLQWFNGLFTCTMYHNLRWRHRIFVNIYICTFVSLYEPIE